MNNDQFFGWWNGDDLTPDNDFPKDSPIWWAWEGWQAALREMNKEAEKNGEPLWDAVDVKKSYTIVNVRG